MLAELGRSSGNAASGQHNSDEESTCLQSRGPRNGPEGPNTQTQVYVYERKIPLSNVSNISASWSSWVALLAPGDPLATFDQVPPSWEQPQILGSICGRYFDALRIAQELELNKQQARDRTPSAIAARPSLLDREAAEIQAKERDMAAIKAKISSMSDAKRQASSAEEQLKEVAQEVVKMRDRLIHLEAEIKDVGDRKQATETEIATLQRSIGEAKETLRLRTLSVAELRSNRDEASGLSDLSDLSTTHV
eukprot:s379_g3.t1